MNELTFDYKRVAEGYKKRPWLHRQVIEKFIESQGFHNRKEKGLDIGCGAGLSCKALSLCCKKVTGTDISKEMIQVAKSFLSGEETTAHEHTAKENDEKKELFKEKQNTGSGYYTAYDFLQIRAEEIDASQKYDVITAAGVMNWVDETVFLPKVKRMLAHGGYFLVYDFWISDRMAEDSRGKMTDHLTGEMAEDSRGRVTDHFTGEMTEDSRGRMTDQFTGEMAEDSNDRTTNYSTCKKTEEGFKENVKSASSKYTDWYQNQYLVKFPKPMRKEEIWTNQKVAQYGLSMKDQEKLNMTYKMNLAEYVEFMLLQSNVISKVEENGEKKETGSNPYMGIEEVRNWFYESLRDVFGDESKELYFDGYLWVIQKKNYSSEEEIPDCGCIYG